MDIGTLPLSNLWTLFDCHQVFYSCPLSGWGPWPGNPVTFSCHSFPLSCGWDSSLVFSFVLMTITVLGMTAQVSCRMSPIWVCLIFFSWLHWDYGCHSNSFDPDIPLWGEAIKNYWRGTSLVAQWLRIHLPTQATQVRSLVREDPTSLRATKPMCHNYWACTPQLLKPTCPRLACCNYWAPVLQLLKPAGLEPVLRNKRRYLSEKPAHNNEE